MISAAAWIRKGIASATPKRYTLTEDEYARIMQRGDEEIAEAKACLAAARAAGTARNTDSDSLIDDGNEMKDSGVLFSSLKNLQASEDDDAVHVDTAVDAEILAEELDDLAIRPSDAMIVACRTEDEVSQLEVFIYEEDHEGDEGNMYVHHDVMLPSFPLCLEWIDLPLDLNVDADIDTNRQHGNFVAIGTFDPEIEIWDVDLVDAVYPTAILEGSKASTKRSKKKISTNENTVLSGHTDAVMSLSWSRLHRSLLLSGSADGTVKLWDLTTRRCMQTFTHHTGKVQVVHWSPHTAALMLSGSYDGTAQVVDCRDANVVFTLRMPADIETGRWSPHHVDVFAVSDESGLVQIANWRTGQLLARLHAHEKPCSALDWSPLVPGLLLTGSTDKTLKLWSLPDETLLGSTATAATNDNSSYIECLAARELGLGKLFTASFSPDNPFLVLAAGGKGKLAVWNTARSISADNNEQVDSERDGVAGSAVVANYVRGKLAPGDAVADK